jgi:SAM-dependent methyltransferase
MAECCPCCMATDVVYAEHEATCPHCLHQWRQGVTNVTANNYYQSLENRNNTQTARFQRKLLERYNAIASIITPNTKTVLEVGCAEGDLGAMVKDKFDVQYDGVEISKDALAARQKLDYVFNDSTASIKDQQYDLIVSFHVLEHIQDIAFEIKQWHRLLTETGTIIVEVPNRAGHSLLEHDNNAEHLHQFSLQSLSCLLGRTGFAVYSATIGHFESAVYNDSLRLVAKPALTLEQKKQAILNNFKQKLPDSFAVYGVGGDFQNYIYPYIQSLPITFLLDSSAKQWGRNVAGFVVQQYNAELHGDLPILIASIRYKEEIIAHLNQLDISDDRIITLDEIYDAAP